MKTAMTTRMLVCLVVCVALECVAAESPVSAVSRMESRTKDPTRDPGLFGDKLVDESGWVPKALMADEIHPTDAGYDIWMDALNPNLDSPD